jgi:hypothetical protein
MNGLKIVSFCVIFQFRTMFNVIFRTGAGAASGYGYDQMMQLPAAPTLHHCHQQYFNVTMNSFVSQDILYKIGNYATRKMIL